MDDLISRQAAIDAAKDWYNGLIVGSFRGLEKRLQAVPSEQPEQSFDEWKKDFTGYVEMLNMPKDDFKGIIEYINEAPSAQPVIIRCKDCKHVERARSKEAARKFGQIYICGRHVLSSPNPDDYCSYAESRTDG